MRIAKAVITAGEGGRPASRSPGPLGVRHLFPVANRPILFHHLEGVQNAGVLEVTILTDPSAQEPIARAVGDGRRWNLNVRVHAAPVGAGLAHALSSCERFAGGEPLLVRDADALLHGRLAQHIAAFGHDGLDAMALQLDAGADRVAPGYLLSPRAQSLLMRRPDRAANPLGEVEASGGRVRVEPVSGCLTRHGDLESLLDCNRQVLQQLEAHASDAVGEDCRVQGPVAVHPTADVRRSTLRGPVIVGPHATIADAYVGPYSSIGAHARIEGSEVEHSIVMPRAEIVFVGTRIESSVIGEGARVARGFSRPSSLQMWIGDRAEVLLS